MSALAASLDMLTLGLFGWQGIDIPLLITLPILLVASGFFSGSETALFGMSQTERGYLRRRGGVLAAAIHAMLNEPRLLLITVLLGNMTVNVLYFVISSVLMMRADNSPAVQVFLAIVFLLAVVMLGEVMPKMLASTRRMSFARVTAPVLFAIHTAITPLRLLLDRAIVVPLSRLTAPAAPPPRLSASELSELLDASGRMGVIARDEQKLLQDVLTLSDLKVRDVMTPRVRLRAIPADATPRQIHEVIAEARVTRLPVYENDLDHIVGMLHAKRFLMGQLDSSDSVQHAMTEPVFVPVMATLDQLLDDFRRAHTKSAIVVDEYGGTEGLVALEDVVERLVGDIARPDEPPVNAPQLIGLNTWSVDGRMSVRDWSDAFDVTVGPTRSSTIGGLVAEWLGRVPQPGDSVEIDGAHLEVLALEGAQVSEVRVRVEDSGDTLTHDAAGEAGS